METKELNIIPISMRCTQEQYKSIKPILDANGISNDYVFSYADTFLVTNWSNDGKDVMNVCSLDAEKFGRTLFTEWDEKIFLKCLGIATKDNINPSHYKNKPKETIERIGDNLSLEETKLYSILLSKDNESRVYCNLDLIQVQVKVNIYSDYHSIIVEQGQDKGIQVLIKE